MHHEESFSRVYAMVAGSANMRHHFSSNNSYSDRFQGGASWNILPM
ncbi:unnamed protein product [Rhodiola kirilowii]